MESSRLQAACCDEGELLSRFGLAGTRLSAPFPLWLVRVPEAAHPDLLDLLSPAEHARAARFAGTALRNRYRAAHGALRLLGQYHFGIAAARQHYEANAFGKPQLAGTDGAHCSISYSGSHALVAWSRDRQIGIDLESVRPIADVAELVEQNCTAGERAILVSGLVSGPISAGLGASGPFSSGIDDFNRAFLTVWVRKEACVKALGRGLDIAPASFECGVGQGVRIATVDGCTLETEVYDLRGDLLVAWARRSRFSSA